MHLETIAARLTCRTCGRSLGTGSYGGYDAVVCRECETPRIVLWEDECAIYRRGTPLTDDRDRRPSPGENANAFDAL